VWRLKNDRDLIGTQSDPACVDHGLNEVTAAAGRCHGVLAGIGGTSFWLAQRTDLTTELLFCIWT